MLKFMLDTNICIFTMKNKPEAVREAFNRFHGQICISSVTFMELCYGVEKSAKPEANQEVLDGFAARLQVLPFEVGAAAHAAEIRAELGAAGTPIGAYDVMIAGHARSLGLVVVTNNTREFARVRGMRLEDWTQISGRVQ